MSPALQRIPFALCLAACTAIALAPVFGERLPALQDYPQQLAQLHVWLHRDDPAFDYARHFDARLPRGPYSLFNLATLLFARWLPLEVAGKLALSLYALGVAALAWRLSRRPGLPAAPWPALLLLPLAFGPVWYLGLTSYLLSLPLVFLALCDAEELFRGPATPWRLLRHGLWQAALVLSHPFGLGLFAVLSGAAATLAWREGVPWRRAAPPPLLAAAAFALWLLVSGPPGTGAPPLWLRPDRSLVFLLGPFAGPNAAGQPAGLRIGLWCAVFALLGWARAARSREASPLPGREIALCAALAAGVFLLPFRVGDPSYLNLRLAPVACFAGACLLARLRLSRPQAGLLVALVAALLLEGGARQRELSREHAQLLPLLERMPRNASVLPLVFDADSPLLDAQLFDPHLHAHAWYHVVVGGGFTPYFFEADFWPVRAKPAARRPAPGEYRPSDFRWERHGAHYDYLLARGGSQDALAYLERGAALVGRSGAWTLLRVRPAPAAPPREIP